MKKLFLAVVAIIFTATLVNAQDKMSMKKTSFSIAANVGAPLTSGFKIAYGADLQGDFGVSHGLCITASGGYENVSYKAIVQSGVTFPEGSFNLIPVLAGLKYSFPTKWYVHGQMGYTFSTVSGGGGSFTFAPSVGYGVGKGIDIALKYTEMGKTNTKLAYGSNSIGIIGLRLGYSF